MNGMKHPKCIAWFVLSPVLLSVLAFPAAAAPRITAVGSMLPDPAIKGNGPSVPGVPRIRVSMAKNEFEAFQVVIESPADHPLEDVTVQMDRLSREGDRSALWPPDGISLWRVERIEAHNLWGDHESLGWFPDPLIPLSGSFSVPAGENRSVWIRLHAGVDILPGTYTSKLTLSAEGQPIGEIVLEAAVYDFVLPVEQHFTLAIPIWGGHMESMYPGSQTTESRRAYLDMLYDYRVAPFPLEDDEVEHAMQRGVRDFNLVCFPKDHVAPEAVEAAAAAAARWRDKGWDELARTYVLLGDEAPRECYPNIQEQGRLLEERAPKTARRFTVSVEMIRDFDWIFAQMRNAADTIILSASESYDTDGYSRRIAQSGFGLWWYYVACHYYIPNACGPAMADGRGVFWRHWKYQVPGQLHWGMTYWGDANIEGKDGKKWPEVPWDSKCSRSGDGYLVYPAPDGRRHYPSVRLEEIRDGIEDYEYFHLLMELTARVEKTAASAAASLVECNRALLRFEDGLVKSYNDYSRDPAAYRAYRERLAEAIMATQRALGNESGEDRGQVRAE